ncbi:Secoisolariciresinol dehydrogenase [Cladophialophora carrionii]|uniref:Secoisolariciresinol dehydrogenase n=1 Tax=Cladophialophora carrionii TaxID=86049 RepID=A0A1C1CXK3_9EURO|nr:Secoisolariciresinol dehydrogenase [Cladophialophora carrionii]
MDPTKFPVSAIPLNHAQYGPITDENLRGINAGKVALVTGGARGIGRAISVKLAISGASIAVLDRLEDELAETATLCEQHGARVKTYVVDVTDVDALRGVLKQAETDLGEIDILVNNAGVSPGRPQWMESFEDFWRTIEINFKSTMVTSWYLLPKFRDRKAGVIINIASRAATVDFTFAVGYNSSKAAVARATSTLQEEVELDGLGDAIQLYALHPGGVPTAMAKKEIRQELLERYPALTQHGTDFQALFKDPPELCGATVTYLAAGKAKELRGMYWDCRQDIERVKAYGRDKLQQEGRYTLKMQFLDGYENEP